MVQCGLRDKFGLRQAMDLYMDGMRLGQRGLLYEAIQKYRRAVQTDSTVEQEVRRVLLARHQQQQQADGQCTLPSRLLRKSALTSYTVQWLKGLSHLGKRR